MTGAQEQAVEKLREQQSRVKDRSPQWMVAEQLMDICRNEPASAELIAIDLENPAMSVKSAEMKIKEFADELHRKRGGKDVFVPPDEADRILRKFYGLPEKGASVPDSGGVHLNLKDFLMDGSGGNGNEKG